MTLDQLVPVLQLSIGPVIVISGVGLVLLSMTNRYGRVIDRARDLAEAIRNETGRKADRLRHQLVIMLRRARVLRLAITLASTSLLLAALLIIALFLVALLHLEAAALLIGLFIACMLSLIISLIVFIVDINMSLTALKVEAVVEPDTVD